MLSSSGIEQRRKYAHNYRIAFAANPLKRITARHDQADRHMLLINRDYRFRMLTLCSCLLLYACAAEPTDQAVPAQTTAVKTYFYICQGEDKSIVVTINGDQGHLFSYQLSQALARKPEADAFSGSDVYYRPHNPSDLAPGQTAEITIRGVRHENCKNNPRAAVWEAAKLRGVDYRALGQEPAWQLEISADEGFLLITEYGANRVEFPYSEPEVNQAQRTTRYASQLGDNSINITIKGEACSDSMSGEIFNSRVDVGWQGKTLFGCGRALH
jgi:uncharacterized membrane protein